MNSLPIIIILCEETMPYGPQPQTKFILRSILNVHINRKKTYIYPHMFPFFVKERVFATMFIACRGNNQLTHRTHTHIRQSSSCHWITLSHHPRICNHTYIHIQTHHTPWMHDDEYPTRDLQSVKTINRI